MTKHPLISTSCPACDAPATGSFCNRCGSTLGVSLCRHCGSDLEPGSRFCRTCGGTVGALSPEAQRGSAVASSPALASSAADDGSLSRLLPWAIAAILLVSVVGYMVGSARGRESGSSPTTLSETPLGTATGPAPDITNMSPRERASRLYDRIMRYEAEGKRDSLEFFAPMAMGSFEMLGTELDIDARYDYGRIAMVTGKLDVAEAQAKLIVRESPNHLLGLALAARTAAEQGKNAEAATIWKQFLSVRDTELQKKLPEYEAHMKDLEQAIRLAQGGK